jgi:hypothetical protein
MSKMQRKRLLVKKFFVSLLMTLSLVIGSLALATPASASINGCPDGGYVCFWNWINYQTGGGGPYVQSMHGALGTCHNLPLSGVAGWPSGKVYDTATSIIINNSGTNSIPGRNAIQFFEWANCNFGGANFSSVFYCCTSSPTFKLYPNLNSNPGGFGDTIGSWNVINV